MIGTSADFARRLLGWYRQHRRDLPWRLPKTSGSKLALNPYHVLVSEAMLQQTQVATVIPYFHRFVAQFPTLQSLADADTQSVLRVWQGLGYYSRARNLQAAARRVVVEQGGKIPSTVEELLKLPGVGRYTAGAVSSIAFGNRSPILDGNVARVLCRIDAVRTDPREPVTRAALWNRAEEILPAKSVGDFNSALMELGAMICAPRSPQCLLCPVRKHCDAQSAGLQNQIPPPKAIKPVPEFHRWTFVIRNGDRYLMQQRPAKGRWAGMWQFATIETADIPPSADLLQTHFSVGTSPPVQIGSVAHALTHRRYRFDVFRCDAIGKTKSAVGNWLTPHEIDRHPLPRPHLKILAMITQ
jgi:A/G-specific adenine glycosylase